MPWKQLPSLALGNDFQEMNVGELPDVTATDGGCCDCWKLQRVAGKAHNMMENALSILIVIFSIQLQQTETSDRKLCNFQHGIGINHTMKQNQSDRLTL